MNLSLFMGDLKAAMQKEGCPICRLFAEDEQNHIRAILREYVNDAETYQMLDVSLGFCPRHTWQMGSMEIDEFGSALGNSIIYERLIEQVKNRLAKYKDRVRSTHRSRFQERLHRFFRQKQNVFFPDDLQAKAKCGVCRMCEQAEQAHLIWLLQGFSDLQPEIRE